MTSQELLLRLTNGDLSAFEELYDYYNEKLYFYLLGQLRSESDARDVLQGVFVRLVRFRSSFRKVKDLDAYIFTVARNESNSFLSWASRKRKREVAFDSEFLELLEPCESAPGIDSELKEEREEINRALLSLPPKQLEIVNLKIYQDLSFKTISQILGISINTAASRYRYAMEKLRDYMEGSNEKVRRTS